MNGRRGKSACYGCLDRTEDCHAACEAYAAERAAKAAERERAREAKIGARQFGEYRYGVKTRIIRQKNAEKRK